MKKLTRQTKVARLRNSPPKLGGVAAPSIKMVRSLLLNAQTGWFVWGTTPPFAKKRANGTPPNLGGELLRKPSILFGLLVLLLLFLGSVREGFAHATPMLYVPDASSVVDKTPERVRIQFSERIEPKASSITIFGPNGSRAEANDGRPDPNDPRVFSVGVKDAGAGTYTVSWQVVSEDDGHFTKGGFTFNVGAAGGTSPHQSAVQVIHTSTQSQAAAIGVELLGQTMFIGMLAALALLWRSLSRQKTFGYQPTFERNCSLMIIAGTLFIVAGVVAFLVLKTVDLQQNRSTGFLETLVTFVTTVDGRFALYRAGLGIVFAAIFFAVRKNIFKCGRLTGSEIVLFVVTALMLLARARVSHAAASHFHPNFSIFVNAVHLLSKEFWVGGVMAFTFTLVPILNRLGRPATDAHTLTLLSKYTCYALAGTGITGAYIVWLHLKSPDYIFTTEWGTRFVLLSVFAGALAAMRLFNQIVVESTLVADLKNRQDRVKKGIASSWPYSIAVEMCFGIAVLFVTSQLIITTPPYPPETVALQKQAVSQGTIIKLAVHPVDQKQLLITVSDEKTGAGVPIIDSVVTIENKEKNLGPFVVEAEPRFIGGFTLPRDSFSIPGQWNIDITARRTGAYDSVASFQLDYPKEIDDSRVDANARHFGSFEAIVVGSALASLLGAFVLYCFTTKLNSQTAETDPSRTPGKSGLTMPKLLVTGLSASLVISFLVGLSYNSLVKTEFQKQCEGNSGIWTQSTPMRHGTPLSSNTMTGCTTRDGADHFIDFREYQFFLTTPAIDEHAHHHH